jgi:hypothetical protein
MHCLRQISTVEPTSMNIPVDFRVVLTVASTGLSLRATILATRVKNSVSAPSARRTRGGGCLSLSRCEADCSELFRPAR